jgi:hypothetical protein
MGEDLNDFLVSQFEHVRNWTLMSTRELSNEMLTYIPDGGKNHILWELGHICWTADYLVFWGCADREQMSKEWEEKYGFNSEVISDSKNYPPLEEIKKQLEEGRDELIDYIRSLTIEELMSPTKNFPEERVPDILSIFKHLIPHEAYHVGKISLIRRMLKLPSVSELSLKK